MYLSFQPSYMKNSFGRTLNYAKTQNVYEQPPVHSGPFSSPFSFQDKSYVCLQELILRIFIWYVHPCDFRCTTCRSLSCGTLESFIYIRRIIRMQGTNHGSEKPHTYIKERSPIFAVQFRGQQRPIFIHFRTWKKYKGKSACHELEKVPRNQWVSE